VNTVDPLYAGRLDIRPGADVPSNWFRLVKPFSFNIQDVKLQRSSVTILNNVIDPTKGEFVRVSYQLAKSGPVTVQVFTLDGDLVQVLYRGSRAAGDYTASWDGKNRGGRAVARGMYFIRVVGPELDEIRKVMVVKQ
jgi:flagellar hook assembly protein FlgD